MLFKYDYKSFYISHVISKWKYYYIRSDIFRNYINLSTKSRSNYQWINICYISSKFKSMVAIFVNLLMKLLGNPFLPSPQEVGF